MRELEDHPPVSAVKSWPTFEWVGWLRSARTKNECLFQLGYMGEVPMTGFEPAMLVRPSLLNVS